MAGTTPAGRHDQPQPEADEDEHERPGGSRRRRRPVTRRAYQRAMHAGPDGRVDVPMTTQSRRGAVGAEDSSPTASRRRSAGLKAAAPTRRATRGRSGPRIRARRRAEGGSRGPEGCRSDQTSSARMVGATGFEPATSRSQSERSTRLSYAPPTEFRIVLHRAAQTAPRPTQPCVALARCMADGSGPLSSGPDHDAGLPPGCLTPSILVRAWDRTGTGPGADGRQ